MSYPFHLKKLDADIQAAIHAYSAYETDSIIESIIDRKGLTDAESHVALAFFIWSNAKVTGFEEDTLQFGEEALEVLNALLEREPNHKGAVSLKKEIERELKKAQKIQKKLEKYNKIPEEKLDLYDAKELAYFLADHKTDRESKLKEYRLWYRLYKEYPDVMPNIQGGYPDEYYGHNYFYLGYAALALWDAGEPDQARVLFEKVFQWPVERDVKLYDHTATLISCLLIETIETNNSNEFARQMEALENHYHTQGSTPTLYTKYVDQILAFALQKDHRKALAYTVNVLMADRSARSLDAATKQHLAQAQALLKEA